MAPPARSIFRLLVRTAALLTFGTIVGLALVEVGMRSIGCVNRPGYGMNVRDRWFGWGNRRNVSTRVQRCVGGEVEFRSSVRTNRWGLRGADATERAAPGVVRILALGDSFTHAAQVDEDASFTTRLARGLSARTHVPTEVLNAGVNGWGTDNALLYFEREGRRFHPDIVLLAFDTTNDVFENARRLVGMRPLYADKPYYALDDGRLRRRHHPLAAESDRTTWAREVVGRLALDSAAFPLVIQRPSILRLMTLPPAPLPADGVVAEPPEVMLRTYPPHWREAWRITRGLLLCLRRATEAQGARLVVVVVSSREEVSPAHLPVARVIYRSIATADLDPDKPNRLVTSFLARRGIPVISLLEPFRERFGADGTPGFFQFDIHWAPAGHALAADVIAERLIDMRLTALGARPRRAASSRLNVRAPGPPPGKGTSSRPGR